MTLWTMTDHVLATLARYCHTTMLVGTPPVREKNA